MLPAGDGVVHVEIVRAPRTATKWDAPEGPALERAFRPDEA
jgi:hypothetical protein